MKMVKSLLLGSASGLVAVAGAQAADLPVKAKPVEYVKVCSLYGAGYYYIPGTDICMKMGGYVREEFGYYYGDNITSGPWISTSMQNTRTNGSRDLTWRTRAYINQETRQQTAYGTLRSYFQIGINGNNSTDLSANRGFIQIAGFTVGLASSYFDHYSVAAIAYLVDQASDTGDGGQRVFAYTAQFGNGVSATLSLEEPEAKRAGVWNTAVGASAIALNSKNAAVATTTFSPALGIAGTTQAIQDQRKSAAPDVVANLRIDQAWGSAQVMGVLHEASGGYYGTSVTGQQGAGYPGDRWGFGVGVAAKINLPMIAAGDYFAFQAVYAEGATRYVSNTVLGNGSAAFKGGTSLGYGFASDGVYCGGSQAGGAAGASALCGPGANAGATAGLPTTVQLTTSWGIAAGWEHFWTPALRTSLHGSYVAVKYNAVANQLICNSQTTGGGVNGNGTANGAATATAAGANTLNITTAADLSLCNNNFSIGQIGSRTQWNVTKDFYMGFDVVYYRLNTASKGMVANYTALVGGAQPSGARTMEDQDVVAGRVRWHRDIVP